MVATAKVLPFPTAPRARASAKESSKILKQTLKAAFPKTKFSVIMSRGTAYGSVDVSWTDGPTPAKVDAILNAFEGKGFDGMTDSTYYKDTMMPDGRESGLGYVHGHRTISPALAKRAAAQLAAYWGLTAPAITESKWNGGYSIEREADADAAAYVKMGECWSTMIYRAASDRTKFAPVHMIGIGQGGW